MLYLLDRRLSDLSMDRMSSVSAIDAIKTAIEAEELISGLDPETINLFSSIHNLEVPDFDKSVFQDASPDDVSITLCDNLELGDEVISTEDCVAFYYYQQFEE